MCGIFCRISRHGQQELSSQSKSLLAQRGPDTLEEHVISTKGGFIVQLTSSVLSMRGTEIVSQPLIDSHTGSCLCWNGEAWKIDDVEITSNDTRCVLDLLVTASLAPKTEVDPVMHAFSRIRGPFACVFFDCKNNKVYFGRDCLGRRSLVLGSCSNGDVLLASVPDVSICNTWTEVEADGLYVMPFTYSSSTNTDPVVIEKRPLYHLNEPAPEIGGLAAPYTRLCTQLPDVQAARLRTCSEAVEVLDKLLKHSVRVRIYRRPLQETEPIAVLFSGGLDCTLLTYYCHKLLPPDVPIDLLNVAFQNPRIHHVSMQDPFSACPDRQTGLSALQELKQRCPGRQFRFVAINVPFSQTMSHRDTIISLMYPHATEMDLSIASALYFASRGQGIISSGKGTQHYTTKSRVLFSGLGADELFAGYSRHAIAFSRNQFPGLIAELNLDFERLGKRNLGRDDRVTSHWGREVRYPYLDEEVVRWAVSCPVWQKCGFGTLSSDPEEPQLEDGKLLLRLLAWKAGLQNTSREKKRAIQFGSRTAKMHARKTKGTDAIARDHD